MINYSFKYAGYHRNQLEHRISSIFDSNKNGATNSTKKKRNKNGPTKSNVINLRR